MIGELEINKIYCMDCIEGMKKLAENSIDSVVTDSPYELEFMGKKWDSSGIAFNKDMWLEVFRVLKPGGHLLSFGGTRTHHRMVCAIEDAGFDIRDEIVWIYGCGFPKSLSIGKAYDNKIGNEREVIGIDEHAERFKQYKEQDGTERKTFNDKITKGTSLYEGLGTSLKPAHEPIVLARKPFKGTVIDNVLKWGTGGINIDDCRIPTTDTPKSCKGTGFASIMKTNKEQGFRPRDYYENQDGFDYESNKKGRFPANLIHDGSDEVLELFPHSKTTYIKSTYQNNRQDGFLGALRHPGNQGFNDEGSASRFFKICKQDDLCALCYIHSCKAFKDEKDIIDIWKKSLVSNAENNGWTTEVITEFIVRLNVMQNQSKNLVLNVKSAGNLCDLCAISIAVILVGIKNSVFSKEELQVILGYITNSKRCILIQNLVSFVELWENTDIIPTIQSLSLLFGSVNRVIINYIQETGRIEPQSFLYCAKASKSERDMGLYGFEKQIGHNRFDKCKTCGGYILQNPDRPSACRCEKPVRQDNTIKGNFHPTIKPLALMQYLVKLVTPKNGLVLDPFMGSGTTAIACKRLNFNFIGFDSNAEYCEIAKYRLSSLAVVDDFIEKKSSISEWI